LQAAAKACGFDANWQSLQPDSTGWSDCANPAHFYLFTLKALAFIRLRRGDQIESAAVLDKMTELDPADSVGASVIRSIAAGVA
jgi:hypothetical protein